MRGTRRKPREEEDQESEGEVMKFRKKPVEIEAVRASEIIRAIRQGGFASLPPWVGEAYRAGLSSSSGTHVITLDERFSTSLKLCITTLEGVMVANETDWVIRGVKGELYPCKPDIFEATYEVCL